MYVLQHGELVEGDPEATKQGSHSKRQFVYVCIYRCIIVGKLLMYLVVTYTLHTKDFPKTYVSSIILKCSIQKLYKVSITVKYSIKKPYKENRRTCANRIQQIHTCLPVVECYTHFKLVLRSSLAERDAVQTTEAALVRTYVLLDTHTNVTEFRNASVDIHKHLERLPQIFGACDVVQGSAAHKLHRVRQSRSITTDDSYVAQGNVFHLHIAIACQP